MTDKQRDIIDEVINYAIKEGVLAPEDAEAWTDEQKMRYYEDMFVLERDVETPY